MPARRGELLDELVALFLAEGFLAFGVGDLAARLRCSRSTLYAVAPSKEQIVTASVRAFFRGATERVEARSQEPAEPTGRLYAYLEAISDELAPASPRFFADVAAYEPAREIYQRNTEWAARRVGQLVAAIPRPEGGVDAAFVGAVAAEVMQAIQRGDVRNATGLADAASYDQLARLLVTGIGGVGGDAGVRVSRGRPSTVPPARSA